MRQIQSISDLDSLVNTLRETIPSPFLLLHLKSLGMITEPLERLTKGERFLVCFDFVLG